MASKKIKSLLLTCKSFVSTFCEFGENLTLDFLLFSRKKTSRTTANRLNASRKSGFGFITVILDVSVYEINRK